MLNAYTTDFVQSSFGAEANFAVLDETNGVLQFKSQHPDLGLSINEASFSHKGQTVFLTLLTVSQNLWSQAAPWLRNFAQTLIRSEYKLAGTPIPDEPPKWQLYAHPTARFAFLYPDTWVITQIEQTTIVSDTETDFTFRTELITPNKPRQPLDFAQNFIQHKLDELGDRYSDWEALPVEAYKTEGAIGYTSDFLYVAEGKPIAGSIIVTEQDEGLVYITLTAPAEAYENALTWFNPMMQSFRLVPPDEVLPTPSPMNGTEDGAKRP